MKLICKRKFQRIKELRRRLKCKRDVWKICRCHNKIDIVDLSVLVANDLHFCHHDAQLRNIINRVDERNVLQRTIIIIDDCRVHDSV